MRQVAKIDLLASDVSASNNYTGISYQLAGVTKASIHVIFSDDSLEGTLKLQASNVPSDWVDISGSSQTVVSGASHLWNITAAEYFYFRFVWENSDGTGTLTAYVVTKWEE